MSWITNISTRQACFAVGCFPCVALHSVQQSNEIMWKENTKSALTESKCNLSWWPASNSFNATGKTTVCCQTQEVKSHFFFSVNEFTALSCTKTQWSFRRKTANSQIYFNLEIGTCSDLGYWLIFLQSWEFIYGRDYWCLWGYNPQSKVKAKLTSWYNVKIRYSPSFNRKKKKREKKKKHSG